MTHINIDILGVTEVSWMGAGAVTSSDKTIIYSGWQADFRGSEIIFDKQTSKAIKGYRAMSDRVVVVKLQGKPLDINIIQVYAPTAESYHEGTDRFYDELDEAMKISKVTICYRGNGRL